MRNKKGQFKKGHKINLNRKRPDMIDNKFGFKKGIIPWNKGKKGVMPEPWNKGKKLLEKTKKKISEVLKGKKLSEDTRKKISKALKGRHPWNKGIFYKQKKVNYKTYENKRIRESVEAHLWRETVFTRDNWTCQKCDKRGKKIHPHHIQNFAKYPKLRFVIDNGITLCKECHFSFHRKYSQYNNTREQLNNFLNIK